MAWRDVLEWSPPLDWVGGAWRSVGDWPLWVRAAAPVALFGLVVGCGYLAFLAGGEERLNLATSQGERLRRDYERKAAAAADLPTNRQRSKPVEGAVSALEQMPGSADVPALLEDIVRAAETNGLIVRGIDLLPERRTDHYGELPLQISVQGGYHSMGAFVSAIVGMARLVTLHDFDLGLVEVDGSVGTVRMDLLAKAYWHFGPELRVESLPPLGEVGAFVYRAGGRRSPFEPSMPGDSAPGSGGDAPVAPDMARPRHDLERHPIAGLAMVGTLTDGAGHFALVRDGAGRVHRLGVGDYLGEDHGRIRKINAHDFDFVEIVPDGEGGWAQRARTLSLQSLAAGLKREKQE